MIAKLNLATNPFRNRVLPYLIAGMLLMISALSGIYFLARLNQYSKENERLIASIEENQAEIDRLKGEGEKVQQLLTPEQKTLLSASHKLVANKTFGWSRLFADLEGVLPGSVSASRISVENIYQDGDRIRAELDLAVISRDYNSVMAMIQNMSNSGLFQAELRGQDLQTNERVTYTEYTFHIVYTPGYGYTTAAPEVAQAQPGGVQ
ncbi:MAG: PilN domain-containing protein [Pyrinomonadaceae bacterium]